MSENLQKWLVMAATATETLGGEEFNAILRLISEVPESRPKVSREWLNQKAGELSTFNFANQHPEIARDWLFNALREAGVIVEEP